MARFYADENFPLAAVVELRRLGHDLLTTVEAGQSGQRIPDEDVLRFAIFQSRAVLTINRRHFVRRHQLTSNHAGIVVCSLDVDFDGLARRIHEAVAPLPSLNRELIRISSPNK
jgi:hypothetical protein